MKAGLNRKEPAQLEEWAGTDLYGKIRRARRGRERFTLHDGPPYPTGELHIGTGMNKILKDFVVRFQTMLGRDAPFIPGWDCHGLPIEHKVMSGLGEKAAGISEAAIRGRCREFALKYVEINRSQFRRLGCAGDWNRPYLTIAPEYEAAVLNLFSKLVAGGYVYRRLKPIHWCFDCRTALAEAELEYRLQSDPSIFVSFPLEGPLPEKSGDKTGDPVSILVWTTTPWTLPANRAVAVHPDFEYLTVEFTRPETGGKERAVIAAGAVERVMTEMGAANFRAGPAFRGRELTGLRYRHPWSGESRPVIAAAFVNLEDGTGCVHIAPGHGQEDYQAGLKEGLEVYSPVGPGGGFDPAVEGVGGRNVFEANPEIVGRLRQNGLLQWEGEISHSYPHCWRCRNPVIFRATRQWFISLENLDLRKRALKEAAETRWVPERGLPRISGMLEQRPDWCISRQRKWGVPIPVFYCRGCGEELVRVDVIDHIAELFARHGADYWFQNEPEALLPPGVTCGGCGGGELVKETDIFDVWFESGSSHRAVVMNNPALNFPADLYLEGSDQHRGWFQLSLLLSVAAWDTAPFRSVVTHGFVVDDKGEKMSKSRGNFISVDDILKEVPADILRLWFSSVDYRRDINLSRALIEPIVESYRKLRNTFRHILGNLYDFDLGRHAVPSGRMLEIDRWALNALNNLTDRVNSAWRDYEFHRAYRDIHSFCVIEMSSFYLDVLKDRLYTHAPDSGSRRSCQTALALIISALVRMLAPIIPFTTEEVWKNCGFLPDREESVHLARWPEISPEWKNDQLAGEWERLLELRSEVMKFLEEFRRSGRIGNSLQAKVRFRVQPGPWADLLRKHQRELSSYLIVSRAEISGDGDWAEEEGFQPSTVDGVEIKIAGAPGEKCPRCWKYRELGETAFSTVPVCRECAGHLEAISGAKS